METEVAVAMIGGAVTAGGVLAKQFSEWRKEKQAREMKEAERELRELRREEKLDAALQKAHDGAVNAMVAAATQTQEVFSKTLDRVNHLFDREAEGHAQCRREVHDLRLELGKERDSRIELERKLQPFIKRVTPPDFPAVRADTPPTKKPFTPPIPR